MGIIAKTKYLEFKSVKLSENKEWGYVRRTNDNLYDSAVVITTIVKINDNYNFLFLKTKRPPIFAENKAQYCIESPAGLIGDINTEESVIECANKELLEEAGLKADKLYLELTNCSSSAGLTSETIAYTTAIVNNYKLESTPVSDDGIITDRFLVKCSDINEYLKNIDTKIYSIASSTLAGILLAQKRLNIR